MDYHVYLDKQRREAAMAEARSRGLDRDLDRDLPSNRGGGAKADEPGAG